MDDKKIIELVKYGNPTKCLEVLYKSEYPKLKKYIIRNSGSDDDAKDIFQEVIMTFFTHVKLGKFKEENQIGGFMYIVGINLWKKKCGKAVATEEIHADMISENHTYEYLFDKEKKELVTRVFQQLGEICHQLLTKVIFERTSMKEIAIQMDFPSVDATKVKHHRCKKKLIEIVAKNKSYQEQFRELFN